MSVMDIEDLMLPCIFFYNDTIFMLVEIFFHKSNQVVLEY